MTTYGEIVEPISRTAWEDWDDIVPEDNNSNLQWKNDVRTLDETDSFLILEGTYLSGIVTMQTQHKLELLNTIPDINLQLLKAESLNTYICIIKDYNLVLSSEIVELLRPYINVCKNVLAIQTKPLSDYISNDFLNQDCIIRKISTATPPLEHLNIDCRKLEQPNIITGVTAGVICLRELSNLSGTGIICYLNHPEDHLEALQNLLKKLNVIDNIKSRPNSILNSNLYI